MQKNTTGGQHPSWGDWPAHPAELSEQERVAADLSRNEDKNSGRLQQQEIDRAQVDELAHLRAIGAL